MFQFSTFVRVFLPALALGVVAPTAAVAQSQPALSLKVYNADGNSFNVNAVVVSGKTEAIVIDSGFTRADALTQWLAGIGDESDFQFKVELARGSEDRGGIGACFELPARPVEVSARRDDR